MAKTNYAKFGSIEELEAFEIVSDNVSDKYVPIYSTEIVKILEPEFKFIGGERYYNFNSAHTIYLEDGDTRIAITNSYDRTRAFGAFLAAGELRIPLNLDRQIHLGAEASALTENFRANKPELFKAIGNAKNIVRNLKNTNIPEHAKEKVIKIAFKKAFDRKGFIELDLNISDNYATCYSFINTAIERYVTGNYHIVLESKTAKEGEVIRKGVKLTSRFIKLQITNEIYAYLAEELPELFI